tara:strand:+ start:274 stop:567 length:294 start_codon:yes stop_codon:yes gene_type:complete
MTKKELKKQETKKVLNMLINVFNIYNIERDNQYLQFWSDYKSHRFQLQMDTRGYDISSWDSVKLSGDGWSQEDIDKQKFASELEELMNKYVSKLVAY